MVISDFFLLLCTPEIMAHVPGKAPSFYSKKKVLLTKHHQPKLKAS